MVGDVSAKSAISLSVPREKIIRKPMPSQAAFTTWAKLWASGKNSSTASSESIRWISATILAS